MTGSCIRLRTEPNNSHHEFTIAMQELFQTILLTNFFIKKNRIDCQEMVRFCAFCRIKPHIPPLI